jgi:hypothetical protein
MVSNRVSHAAPPVALVADPGLSGYLSDAGLWFLRRTSEPQSDDAGESELRHRWTYRLAFSSRLRTPPWAQKQLDPGSASVTAVAACSGAGAPMWSSMLRFQLRGRIAASKPARMHLEARARHRRSWLPGIALLRTSARTWTPPSMYKLVQN